MTIFNKPEEKFFLRNRKEIVAFQESLKSFIQKYDDQWLKKEIIGIMGENGFNVYTQSRDKSWASLGFNKKSWTNSRKIGTWDESYFVIYIGCYNYLSDFPPYIGVYSHYKELLAAFDSKVKNISWAVKENTWREYHLDIDANDVIKIVRNKPSDAKNMYEKEIEKFLNSGTIKAIESIIRNK